MRIPYPKPLHQLSICFASVCNQHAIVDAMKILVIDVGGTHVKVHRPGHKEPVKIPSGPKMTRTKWSQTLKRCLPSGRILRYR